MFTRGSRLKALRQSFTPESPLLILERDRDTSLEWRQPRWDQYLYRLESARGLLALIETVGFLKLKTAIRTAAGMYRLESRWDGGFQLFFEQEPEARIDFKPAWWSGGRLLLRDGQALQWKAQGLSGHLLETEEGFALAEFARSKEWFKSGSEVTVHDALWRRADAIELLCMGFAVVAISNRRTTS